MTFDELTEGVDHLGHRPPFVESGKRELSSMLEQASFANVNLESIYHEIRKLREEYGDRKEIVLNTPFGQVIFFPNHTDRERAAVREFADRVKKDLRSQVRGVRWYEMINETVDRLEEEWGGDHA